MSMHKTLRTRLALVGAVLLASSAWAQMPVPDPENLARTVSDQMRLSTATKLQLREAGVLFVFTDTVSGKKAWLAAACQPLKGEHVKLVDFSANVGGVRGVNSARIKVAEGRCKGIDGWVGTTYLDAVQ